MCFLIVVFYSRSQNSFEVVVMHVLISISDFGCLCRLALALLELLLRRLLVLKLSFVISRKNGEGYRSYQSAGSAVQSVSVVSPELGVSTLERRVSGSLGLLDAVREKRPVSFCCAATSQPAPSLEDTSLPARISPLQIASSRSVKFASRSLAESKGKGGSRHTHSGAPCATGCAGTSSWIL